MKSITNNVILYKQFILLVNIMAGKNIDIISKSEEKRAKDREIKSDKKIKRVSPELAR